MTREIIVKIRETVQNCVIFSVACFLLVTRNPIVTLRSLTGRLQTTCAQPMRQRNHGRRTRLICMALCKFFHINGPPEISPMHW